MLKKIAVAILLVHMTAGMCFAHHYTGNDLYDKLQKPSGSSEKTSVFGYIDGVSDSFNGISFDIPKGIPLQKICDIVNNYIKANQDIRDKEAVYIIIEALSRSYPKKK